MKINFDTLKKAELKKLSFEDIFLSKNYKNELQSIVNTACRKVGYKNSVYLHLINDEGKEDVAFTDGKTITINICCDFGKRLREKPLLFHIYIIGLIAHELGHIFWTDFNDGEKYMKSIMNGILYPKTPNHKNGVELKKFLDSGKHNKALAKVLHNIDNILEDIYVNAMQGVMLGGTYHQGINLFNTLMAEETQTITMQIDNGVDEFFIIMNLLLDELKIGTAYYGAYEAKYKPIVSNLKNIADKYIFADTHTERVNGCNLILCELWPYFIDMIDRIENNPPQKNNGNGSDSEGDGESSDSGDGNNSNSGSSQSSNKDDSQSTSGSNDSTTNKDDGNSSGCSGNENESEHGTSSAVSDDENTENETKSAGNSGESDDDTKMSESEFLEELEKLLEENLGSHSTSETKNCHNSKLVASDEKPNSDNLSEAQNNQLNELIKEELKDNPTRLPISAGEAIVAQGSGSIMKDDNFISSGISDAAALLKKISESIANENTITSNEENVEKQLSKEIEDIDFGDIHGACDKTIYRLSYLNNNNKYSYDLLAKDILPIARKMVSVIKRTIKEENLSGERRGKYYGKGLDTSRLYRSDNKVWKDRKKPQKEIDFAISLLIDISGSTSGSRNSASILTAILFAEVCQALNIPLEINGHNAYANHLNIYNCINYDAVNPHEKYRIMELIPNCCNRDGAAIIFAAERLLKRPEQKKMLIVISDGQPNDLGYSGEMAMADIKHLKNKYSKQNINVVAAAIGDDKEIIKSIYGKNYLDISNLNSMPQLFAEILKNAILDGVEI